MTLQVFLSIKGIYYQADIHGQTVTWITPYQFSQEVSQLWFTPRVCLCSEWCMFPLCQLPTDVDFRVMLTFVEFYATLMGFVNFKLYHSLNLKYPPQA